MVYKTAYAKNPFDNISDQELEEYRKIVERKQRGEPGKFLHYIWKLNSGKMSSIFISVYCCYVKPQWFFSFFVQV